MLCLVGILFLIYFATKKMRASESISDDDSTIVKNKIEWSQKPTLPKRTRTKKKTTKKIVDRKTVMNNILDLETDTVPEKSSHKESKPLATKKPRVPRKVKVREVEDIIIDNAPTIVNSDNTNLREINSSQEDLNIEKAKPFWE